MQFLPASERSLLKKCLALGFFLCLTSVIFTNKVSACAEDGTPVSVDNCVPATYCANPPAYTCDGACQGNPPSNQVFQKTIRFEYSNGRPACTSTVYFKNQTACQFTQLNQQASNLQCSISQRIGTCNRVLAQDNPNQYVFTGACDTNAGVYCVGSGDASKSSCSNYQAGAEGNGEWCVQYNCYGCVRRDNAVACERQYAGNLNAQATCAANCVMPTCTGCNASTACTNDGTTSRQGVDSCGNTCYVPVQACPTYTPTPTPVPGDLSCTGWSSYAVNPSESGGACGSSQYCVRMIQGYAGNPGPSYPVAQSWNFGDGTTGYNLDNQETYHGYNYGARTVTVSVNPAREGAGSGPRQVSCPGQSVSIPNAPGGPAPTNPPSSGGGTCDSSQCNATCSAPNPGPGQTTWGTCCTGASCSKTGPSPTGESTKLIRLFNANGATPLSKNITVNMIFDRRTADGGWEGNAHGPYSPYFYHWTAGGNVCEFNDNHQSFDAGWQMTSNGSVVVGPPNNLDPTPARYRVCDNGANECGDDGGCTWQCYQDHWEGGNDSCIIGMANPAAYGTFYSSISAGPGSLGPYPNNRSIGGESGSFDYLRGLQYSFAVGAPAGYKIRVVEGCTSDYEGGCGAATGGAAYLYGTGGRVVKDFNQGGPGGYLNIWQAPYQRVNSNAFFYAYDIHISGPEDEVIYHNISGNAYVDANCDGASEGAIPGGARINLTGTQSRVTGTDAAGNWAINNVLAGPGQSHRIDVIPNDNVTIWRACGGTNGTNTITYTNPDATNKVFNVGFAPVNGPWFQVRDADLFANGNIVSRIPTTCVAPGCNPYLELNGSGNYPGVPMYAASLTLGAGNVSTNNWRANTTYQGTQYNYNTLNALLPSAVTFNTIGGGSINWSNLTTGTPYNGYYWQRRTGDLTISGGNVGAGRAVLFVQGNLYINDNVTVAPGQGFLAVVVSGNIYIAPGVTNIQGLFLANGNIFTGSGSSQLNVRGALVGWGGITLQRDLDPARTTRANNTQAAEIITSAPDLLMLYPKEMMRDSLTWREIAP